MSSPADTRRPVCPLCLRPQRACICRWITPAANSVEVLILQHPLEVRSAKGSARLLHLSLAQSRMIAGETFDEQELRILLAQADKQPVLLYPEPPESAGKTPPVVTDRPEQFRLVVLDGTWRKSRKLLHLNPALQSLPRLALTDVASSRYHIRKAHRPDQLSTLEAVCQALALLERCEEKYQPLLDAFDGFVAQQSACFRRGTED